MSIGPTKMNNNQKEKVSRLNSGLTSNISRLHYVVLLQVLNIWLLFCYKKTVHL